MSYRIPYEELLNSADKPNRNVTFLFRDLSGGLPPSVFVEEFLVGREEERLFFSSRMADLQEGRGFVQFLTGKAGVGKSHLLRAIEFDAYSKGFVLGQYEFSQGSGSLAGNDKTRILYNRMMKSLKCRDKTENAFLTILEKWFRNIAVQHECPISKIEEYLEEELEVIRNMSFGDPFARVILYFYIHKIKDGNSKMGYEAGKWFCGEFEKKIRRCFQSWNAGTPPNLRNKFS
jgi:hypothetical protein